MSQQKTSTNFDKGRAIRDIRLRLGLTQKQMAERLELNSTYLSELENGRHFDEHYLKKAQALFDKSKKVEEGEGPPEVELEKWKRRALTAEKQLNDLRTGLRSLLELSSSNSPSPEAEKSPPPHEEEDTSSSSPSEIVKHAEAANISPHKMVSGHRRHDKA